MTEGESTPIRLAVVCNTTRCGGVYRVASALCNAWARQGRTVYLIALHDYESFFRLEPSVRRLDALASKRMTRAARLRRQLANLLLKISPVVQHSVPGTLYDALLLFGGSHWLPHRVNPLRTAILQTDAEVVIALGWQANILTILACRNLGRTVVISERNDVASQRLEYPWEQLRRGLYNRANLVTANTSSALETMQTYVNENRLAYVPNPLVPDDSNAETQQGLGRPAAVVLIVARLNQFKAHNVLLEAFAQLSPAASSWRLAIVGGGEQEQPLREQAETLGIADRVDWHGLVANPFIFYRTAGMFVLPSRFEGMPNALMEAMSCGLPVIVSNGSPGPLELIRNGETGLVVPFGDASALAKAIDSLARDAALRKRLGDAGRRHVAQYDVLNVMPAWELVLGDAAKADHLARSIGHASTSDAQSRTAHRAP